MKSLLAAIISCVSLIMVGGVATWLAIVVSLALLLALAAWDYRRYARRTNASAVWAWAVTRVLEAQKDLDVHALDTSAVTADPATARYLDPDSVVPRQGPRPAMVRGLPHRQLDQHPAAELRARMLQRIASLEDFRDLADDRLVFRPSLWELTGAEALVFKDVMRARAAKDRHACAACSGALFRAKGEMGHIHSHDGSLHLMMAPRDVVTVIEKGWGELFAVANALGGKVPWVALVYAPRTEAECETVVSIARAACRYAVTPSQETP